MMMRTNVTPLTPPSFSKYCFFYSKFKTTFYKPNGDTTVGYHLGESCFLPGRRENPDWISTSLT